MNSARQLTLAFLVGLIVLPAAGCRQHAPKAAEQKLTSFILVAPQAKAVFLAGTFNGWNTTSTPLQRSPTGWWQVDLPIEPRRYSYKFIADGHWMPDPANSESEPDGHGGRNSKLTINPGMNDDGPAYKEGIAARSRRLFIAGDFGTIEKEAAQLRKTRAHTVGGARELALYYNGLNPADYVRDDSAGWHEAWAKFDAWHAQFPDSITEPPARALTFVRYAWQARGDGSAATVKRENWRPFEERLEKARAVLETAAKLPVRCPEWWFAMQNVALGQGWDRPRYEQLFEEAVGRDSAYYDYYSAKAYWLFPRWYGKEGEWERFAADAPARYDSAEGMALYARIARSAEKFFHNIFEETEIQWPKMRQGFLDLARQYPKSRWNLNNFCHFACLAKDRPTAHQLFQQIGSDYSLELWDRPALFEAWKSWADPKTQSTAIEPLGSFAARDKVGLRSLVFLKDRTKLLTGSDDGSLIVWDATDGGSQRLLAKLDHPVKGLAVSPQGGFVAVATGVGDNQSPGSVEFVELATGRATRVISDWHSSAFAVAFAPDGSTLAAVGGDYHRPCQARLLSLTNKEVKDIPWPQLPFAATALAFSPDGRFLAVNDNMKVRVWDWRGNEIRFEAHQPLRLPGYDIAFSPDGKWIAASYSPDPDRSDRPGAVAIWSTADGTLRQPPLTTPGGIHALAFSPDGRYLAGAGYDQSIYLWDGASGQLRETFLPLNGFIPTIAFAPDSRALAASTDTGHLTIWTLP